jgi:hypothetical protein
LKVKYKQLKIKIMGLFTPAWKSKNEEKALRAVEKMTDPEKLDRRIDVAMNKEYKTQNKQEE